MSNYVFEYWIEPMAEIEAILESYVELSPYQILFEADNPDISNQMKQNAGMEKQADSALGKIITGILNLISNIISTITTFFGKLFMNGNERAAFDEIEKKVQSIPGMENKKITMKDFKKLNAEFNRLDKASKAEIEKIKKGQTPSMEILNQMDSFINQGLSAGVVTIATKIGLQAAKDDIGTAKAIQTYLDMDQRAMKTLQTALGDRSANKFKKQIDKLSSECMFYRKRVNMFGKHYNTLQENIVGTMQEFGKLCNGELTMTNLGFLTSLLGNKNFRQKAVKPGVKMAAKVAYSEVKNNVKNKLNGNKPGTVDTAKAAGRYITGIGANKQQQTP